MDTTPKEPGQSSDIFARAHAPKLVGVYAPAAQSGKSSVANVFVAQGYRRVKFADPLKNMVRSLLRDVGFDNVTIERYVEGDLKEVPIEQLGGKTSRFILQTIGTDWGREIMYPNLWIDVAMAKVDRYLERGYNVVVDDLRFPNELAALNVRHATTIRVTRPGFVPTSRYEGAMDEVRFHIDLFNNGTLEQLKGLVLGAKLANNL